MGLILIVGDERRFNINMEEGGGDGTFAHYKDNIFNFLLFAKGSLAQRHPGYRQIPTSLEVMGASLTKREECVYKYYMLHKKIISII